MRSTSGYQRPARDRRSFDGPPVVVSIVDLIYSDSVVVQGALARGNGR